MLTLRACITLLSRATWLVVHEQVKVHDQSEQRRNHDQTQCDRVLNNILVWLSASHAFIQQEHHVTTVQNRNRQEVDHGKIDAQETEKVKETGKAAVCLFVRDLADPNRTTEGANGKATTKE